MLADQKQRIRQGGRPLTRILEPNRQDIHPAIEILKLIAIEGDIDIREKIERSVRLAPNTILLTLLPIAQLAMADTFGFSTDQLKDGGSFEMNRLDIGILMVKPLSTHPLRYRQDGEPKDKRRPEATFVTAVHHRYSFSLYAEQIS
ncbi:MAG: hypothetical protein AAF657_00590 [Acidobacteriota bacterium]